MIAILADAFVKATVLLLLAAIVTLCLRRSPASLRHLVWSLACGAALACPFAPALLPNWRVAGWPRLEVAVAVDATQVAGARVQTRRAPRPAPAPAAREPAATVPSSTVDAGPLRWRRTPDWSAFVFPVWLGGVAVVLVLLGIGMARIFRLARVHEPMRAEGWLILAAEV